MVVTVTNVNEGDAEATVVTLSSLQPKVGVPLTATLDDPDGGEKDIKWQWSISRCYWRPLLPLPVTSAKPRRTPTPRKQGTSDAPSRRQWMYADAEGSDQTGTEAAANAPW